MGFEKCVSVVVVSDRVYSGESVDESGVAAVRYLAEHGISTRGPVVVRNIPRDIVRAYRESECRTLIFLGGTGVSPRDITIDTLKSISWREVPGFGEYFRERSIEDTGPRALLSRASLFIAPDGKVLFALPGSPRAVKLGVDILLSIIDHLIEEVDRFEGAHK